MRGVCLCGAVEFMLREPLPNIYQCHCSLCRKATGSSANAGFYVVGDQITWISGREQATSFVRHTGYSIDFCKRCGSPVPSLDEQGGWVWVPAGLLEDKGTLQVAAHIFTDSKASWETIGGGAPQYESVDFDQLLELCSRPAAANGGPSA